MDDDLPPEDTNQPETDYIIDVIQDEEISIAYGLYCKLRGYQYHYNGVKSRYKKLSLTWLLATFIGFWYLLTGEESGLPIDNLQGVAALGILSSIGILLIGFLDIAVYHRLIESIFVGCIELEKKFGKLTFVHHNMERLLVQGKTGPVIYDTLFYCSFSFILLLTSNIAIYIKLSSYESNYAFLVSCLIFSLIIIIEVILFLSGRRSSAPNLFDSDEEVS